MAKRSKLCTILLPLSQESNSEVKTVKNHLRPFKKTLVTQIVAIFKFHGTSLGPVFIAVHLC